MRHFILPLALIAFSQPAQAQESPLDNLLRELETLSQEGSTFLKSWAETLRPSLEGLADQIPDFDLYEAPEVLPNGDIIIRRKPTKPDADTPPKADQIEL